jgi:hypothetical protein
MKWILIILLIPALFAGNAIAQEFIVFPAQGQSEEQMEKDKFECYSWAKGQTGFDPMQMPTVSEPPPPKSDRSVAGTAAKGGATGAALGGVIGGIADGSSGARRGLAIGALSGGALGGMRSSRQNRQAEQQRKQWEQQQVNQYMQQRNTYNRAYSACLEGKGYTVR